MLLNAFIFPSIFLLHTSFGLHCDSTTTSSTISTIFSNTNIETLFPSWWKSSCNICDWNTTYITCSTSHIIAIQMESVQLNGYLTINATNPWPPGIKLINLNHNSLTGPIAWTYLPQSIQVLYLGHNALTGSIDFDALNQYTNLTALYLSHNKLTSSLSWQEYNTTAPSLQYLFLTNNELFGSIDFNHMPYTLKYCLLGHNQLNGPLDFGYGHLNATDDEGTLELIEYLDISHNALLGNITNLENIGQHITYLRMNNNHLYAEINEILNVFSDTDIRDLSVSHNNITGAINWDIFNNDTSSFAFLESLYIHSNQISGDIIASLLPANLEKFYFSDNKFDALSELSSIPNSLQFLIGDNNAFTGELDLSFINNNIEYIWLYNNLFNSTNIDMNKFNSTSLKQLILSNNRFKNRINLQFIDTYLPNLQQLYLENNLFENADDLDFSDISADLNLKLDEYLSCDESLYCDNTYYNCSISRKNNTCRGALQCADSCECQFSANCSLYIDDQQEPETYFDGNYSVNYHDIMRDIDMKYGDGNMDAADMWLLQTINIDAIIPMIAIINTTSTMFEISTSILVTSTDGADKNALAEVFGSEAVAWIVFVICFIAIVLSICLVVKCLKGRHGKHADIVHNVDIEEADQMEDNGNKAASHGLATKYVTLEPILKAEDVKADEFVSAVSVSDGSDIGHGDFGDGDVAVVSNAAEQQQLMMQMMMVNNMMMAQMQQNMDPQHMDNMMMANNMDPQQLSMTNTLNMQQLAMAQMGAQQANIIPAAQVQSMDSMQNMPIVPFQVEEVADDKTKQEAATSDDRQGTRNELPTLPDENAESVDETTEASPQQVQGQSVEMQQFSMAPFD